MEKLRLCNYVQELAWRRYIRSAFGTGMLRMEVFFGAYEVHVEGC